MRTARTPTPDDELLTAQLQSLDRKLEHSEAERRRLLDVYQTGLVELAEFQRRVGDVDLRRRQLTIQKEAMVTQRGELAQDNRLRQRVGAFAERIRDGLDELTFEQRQRLLRLVVEQVRVQGWQVEIRLRIPLDDPSDGDPVPRPKRPRPSPSTDMRLRSVGVDELAAVIRIDAPDGEGEQPSRMFERVHHTVLGAVEQRQALGPRRGDIGQGERVQEGPVGPAAAVGDQVTLQKARLDVGPLGERSYGDLLRSSRPGLVVLSPCG